MLKGLTRMLTRILTTRLLVVVPIIAMLSVSGCGISWYTNRPVSGNSVVLEQVATPEIALESGTYNVDQHITISCATPEATIYYTTDDTDPTTSTQVYSDVIDVSGQGTVISLKAIAVKEGMDPSGISVSKQYAIDYAVLPAVSFSPAQGTFSSDTLVTMSVAAAEADIYYTLDGTTPTKDSTKYAGEDISVAGHRTSVTIKAIAIQDQMQDSPVSSASYTINYSQIASVVFSPSGGTFSLDQDVALSVATAGATIHYTTDGSTPTELSPEYISAIAVAGHGTVTTIKAMAVMTGMLDSDVTSETYTINYNQVSTPQFSIPGAVYATDQSVALTDATSGAVIHYTTNGSTPTSGSPVYVGAISVAGHGTTMTIKAIATKGFMLDSTVASATYTITYALVATPTFSVPAGTYNSDQTVALSTTTSGAVIHYTTDGSTPTSSSTTYSSAISVAGHGTSMTIKAIAVKNSMLDSAVASAAYTITYDQVATPTFSPTAGAVLTGTPVSISCATSGAIIHYTTDGSTPTASSALYVAPIAITTAMTIKAIAVKTGCLDSAVASSSYTKILSLSHLAGPGGSGSADGTGAAASFNNPGGITSDGTNFYVSDISNNTIRKIVISTGVVTTFAGTAGTSGSTDGTGAAARFNGPRGITSDGTNLYVAEYGNHTIRKIVISTGVVTTFAGTAGSSGSADGTGASARFNGPYAITNDGTNLYVAEYAGQTIRKIVISTAVVTTLAGTAGSSGSTDGTGAAARFNGPSGIVGDGTNLYVTDRANQTIRKIVISTGVVTTFAGTAGTSGSTDGTGAAARFYNPLGIITDGTNLYVTDFSNYTIRKIVISTTAVTTIAGTVGSAGSADGTGAAARFNNSFGVVINGSNLYVTDYGNHTIRKVVLSTAEVTTFAGVGGTTGETGSTDGTGSAARFSSPAGVATDGTNLYVVDGANHTVRKIVISTGVVTTFAGTAGATGSTDGTGAAARFTNPRGLTSDGTNLYVVDYGNHTIRKIVISTAAVTTLAGTAGVSGSVDGTGVAARFKSPYTITNDGTNLYVADYGNNTIREIVISTGVVTTLAGTAGTSGSTDGTGAAARFNAPYGVTTDGTNLYLVEGSNHTIRKIVISTGVVTTFAGTAGASGSTDGTGAAARFNMPIGITNDGTNLYVAEYSNHTIRKVVMSTAVVTTYAGIAGTTGHKDGVVGVDATTFNIPFGISYFGEKLFITEAANNDVRMIQ